MIFSGKIFLILHLLQEILGNLCIAIICFTVYYVINFEIYLNFLISCFAVESKKSEQQLKYRTKRAFKVT